ncbi:MAG TPA: methyltransferase domain-containing protein [Firmicutes bacterium]|jgi:predicted SAM-dependent methyltransferase|nr:methyltransferase domain-containing protein [Bacillota bacterium]
MCDKKKLEFGCGEKLREGYIGVDIRPLPNVKYVCNAWEIVDYVQPESVDAIYSRHFLEHLTYAQLEMTLYSWRRILKPNGTLHIIVPDINYHMRQILYDNYHEIIDQSF